MNAAAAAAVAAVAAEPGPACQLKQQHNSDSSQECEVQARWSLSATTSAAIPVGTHYSLHGVRP
jgi:hypothetical protein